MKLRTILAGAILAAITLSSSALAATVTWDAGGGASTQWNTDLNWSTNAQPDPADDLIFGTGGSAANLNGARTANSININRAAAFTISDSTSSASGLTLTSGTLSWGTNNHVISSNLTLGANGVWASSTAHSLTVSGAIGQTGGTRSLSLNGTNGGTLNLTGSNSFGGGLAITGGTNFSVNLRNAAAAGSGIINVSGAYAGGANALRFGSGTAGETVNFGNTINFSSATGSASITIGLDTTNTPAKVILGGFTGTVGSPTLNVNAGGRTIEFTSGLAVTTNGNGIRLVTDAGTTGTFLLNGEDLATSYYNIALPRASVNLLQKASGVTVNKQIVTAASATGIDTIGGVHSSGTTTFAGQINTQASTGVGANAVGVNIVSLNSGARTVFGQILDSGTSARGLDVNNSFTDNINGTNNPTGIVVLGRTEGTSLHGTVTVHAGTLLVNNTSGAGTGEGNVVVLGGATLGGTGIIAPTGSNGISVQNLGVINPGDGGIGTLRINSNGTTGVAATFESGAKFTFDLNAAAETSDNLLLQNGAADDFAFNDNVINFNLLAGSLMDDQIYTLFSGTNPNQFDGLTTDGSGYITSGLSIGSGLSGAFATYSTLQVVGNDIVLNAAVPEPSTWLLLTAGLSAMTVFRRRRNS